MVENTASNIEVRNRINERFNSLFLRDNEGSIRSYVCIVCDEFINPHYLERMTCTTLQESSDVLTPELWNSVTPNLAQCYRYEGEKGNYDDTATEENKLERMLLSPRASYLLASNRRMKDGFSCCRNCHSHLKKGIMPKNAIANNFCFGRPPQCLLDLTEVEIALLTPVKTYGYCFSYTGGKQKQLKGSLAYYKVDIKSVARSAMQLDVLGLNQNIVVILYGCMTAVQHKKARENSRIRTNYVLDALKWLCNNNEEWIQRGINLNEIRQQLMNPLVVDNSILVEGSESTNDIERTESFQVFFPDGTMATSTAGQESIEKFTELLQAASRSGYDIGIKSNVMKEAVSDFRDNNLVNACLLQFPYGRGGMHEQRINEKGAFTCNMDIEEYVQHLSRISQPHFHHELFTLILYNLSMKQAMVRNAGWKVRNKFDAKALAEELTMDDVNEAINNKVEGRRKRKYGDDGNKLLSAIDAMAKSVPHTNEAAKAARNNGECIQHHFGTPSIFLTITPDDDNSFLVQVFTNEFVDDETPVKEMTDAQLLANAKKRTELRIKYPGICALYFEYALEIVIEEVIGWDLKEGKARKEKPGLFGTAQAFTVTVEEQGRRTLHTHIQVWLEKFNMLREELHSENHHIRNEAERSINTFVDEISKCRMFFEGNDNGGRIPTAQRAFQHQCDELVVTMRRNPVLVDDQRLRNLRQKKGSQERGDALAYCPHCPACWSSDELVESYLICGRIVQGLTHFPDTDVRRLKAMALEYQKCETEDLEIPTCAIDAAYNHHSHTRSCFEKHSSSKEDGSGRRSKKEDVLECRYRYPQRSQRKTLVQNASLDAVPWFQWDGSKTDRFIKEVCPKRGIYDVFQNVCCPAISYSKLACNTNITTVMPGPVGQYSFKYNLKGTQKEDTAEYGGVKEAMQKVLSKLRTYQSDRSEAVKRLLAASFAHQRTNVVGSSMASYLTRNKTRFHFSHKMAWCPLRDIRSLVDGGGAHVLLMENNKVPFFHCAALHYLSRPDELHNVNAFQFYSKYEVVRATKQNRQWLLEFSNKHHFKHPSYRGNTKTFLQGVRERVTPHLLKIFQYDFPDTAAFGGSFMDEAVEINMDMEEYSKLVLLLFFPFRSISDLTKDGSFTLKLREAVQSGVITEDEKQFLQNLQDTRSNSFRISKLEDDLQRRTKLMKMSENNGEEEWDVVEDTEPDREYVDQLLQLLELENSNMGNDDDDNGSKLPDAINFAPMRGKGSEKCGYKDLIKGIGITETSYTNVVLEVEEEDSETTHEEAELLESEEMSIEGAPPSQHEIVTVLLTRTRRRRRTFQEITGSSEKVKVLEANGSARSIIDWARKARLDKGQRRAFEIITSTFILTFYADAGASNERIFGDRPDFNVEKRRLQMLSGENKRKSEQLILLLHGPGGSGKTTVIDMVRKYAEEFCGYLEHFEFTPRTIMVTAMTGVAATILLGETTHSAVYLNQRKELEPHQIEAWAGTRLLIIDEISFASKEDFQKLHKRLRRLKQQLDSFYGGLHMVFSGDMRQLEPVGAMKKPIYEDNCPEFKNWVNCFIELNGMHRFRDDMEWGRLLRRFRNGTVTPADIKKVNDRVVNGSTVLPDNIRYATYFNRDRDSINTALFEERCKVMKERNGSVDDSVLIFSDNVFIQDGAKKYVRLRNCQSFWENCGEDSVKLGQGQGRMDPLLKLYIGCRLMLTRNMRVREGEANGTQVTLEKVVLKNGVEPGEVVISGNIPVAAVLASQVSYLVLRHANERIQPPTFKLFPKEHTFKANLLKPRALQVKGNDREMVKMKATQVPVVVNNATTGHKLQGSGVDCLFVHNWSYVTNWVYVMLSRVKTRGGLYCRKPISTDLSKYAVPQALQRMLRNFSGKLPTFWSEEEYDDIFEL